MAGIEWITKGKSKTKSKKPRGATIKELVEAFQPEGRTAAEQATIDSVRIQLLNQAQTRPGARLDIRLTGKDFETPDIQIVEEALLCLRFPGKKPERRP